jgi:HK97 family phage portal protein
MKLLGFEFRAPVVRAPVGATVIPQSALQNVSFLARVGESFAGAWQRNVELENSQNILKFSAVYSCVSLIANDIAKLRIKLVQGTNNGTWTETVNPAFSPVLRKPNRYQTRIQFLSQWVTSKLLHGNAYILKEYDGRLVVKAMYVLDPQRVLPLVTDDGAVYYRLKTDHLAQLQTNEVTIPATDIIHDRMLTLWHPLVGVSPIYACGSAATQGIRIQSNSAKFFENMSRPSGILTAPGPISDELAARLKAHWESNYVGGSIGKVAVLGEGLKYEGMTIPASDAQLIEQLRWTVEDVARCFHVPLHKLGMGQPTLNNIGALNQDYYTQTLQSLIESIELLLDEGLYLPETIGTELDLEGLLRMDPLSVADANERGVRAGIVAPNEARLRLNLPPVIGGDTPYMQQQNWSLEALNRRPPPDTEPEPDDDDEDDVPEPDDDDDDPEEEREEARALAEAVVKRFSLELDRVKLGGVIPDDIAAKLHV